METDEHYFFEGLFVICFCVAAAFFAVWLGSTGRHDDIVYRIRFSDSVTGLAVGDPVKFRGVDVGSVKAMVLDPGNPRLVMVDVRLRKDTPVMTDTRATLAMRGITGTVFIELSGGDPAAKTLLAATPADKLPEIPYERAGLKAVLEELPKLAAKFSVVADKFSRLEDQAAKVVSGVGALTEKVTDDPSLLLRRPKDADKKK